MSRICTDASVILGTVALILVSGCTPDAGSPYDFQQLSRNGIEPPLEPPEERIAELERAEADRQEAQPVKEEPSEEQKRLADLTAIEEFLERTEAYDRTAAEKESTAVAVDVGDSPSPLSQGGLHPDFGKKIEPAKSPATDPQAGLNPPEPQSFANTQVQLTSAADPAPPLALPVIQSVSIRTPTSVAPDTTQVVEDHVSNTPIELDRTHKPFSLDDFVADLEKQAEETSDLDTQWQLSMIRLALGRDEEATQLSENLSPDTRRILTGLVNAAVVLRGAARNPLCIDGHVLDGVDDLRNALADLADPIVRSVALCRSVVTFGVYEVMDELEFVAGRSIRTIVYCEVGNFKSQEMPEGMHQTVLGTRLEVLSADGKSVWQQEEPEIEDLCRGRRSDFFLAQRITLPPTLPAGDYVLKVYVEDKLSGRANEANHPFRMIEQSALAAEP
ncbi:MAG: hypothetical protein JSV78_10120 [Phycisphaerales bacterium]|nr:MAG: hypothetical protein JSV78_10120 [Phycisphaerales bacterium]